MTLECAWTLCSGTSKPQGDGGRYSGGMGSKVGAPLSDPESRAVVDHLAAPRYPLRGVRFGPATATIGHRVS